MTDLEIVEIMYSAKYAEFGLKVACEPSFESVRQRFYQVRAKHPDLNNLIFAQSPTSSSEMWIINRPEPSDASEV